MSDEAATEPDRIVKVLEVKRRVGLGKTRIYRVIGGGRFPAPYKISHLSLCAEAIASARLNDQFWVAIRNTISAISLAKV